MDSVENFSLPSKAAKRKADPARRNFHLSQSAIWQKSLLVFYRSVLQFWFVIRRFLSLLENAPLVSDSFYIVANINYQFQPQSEASSLKHFIVSTVNFC